MICRLVVTILLSLVLAACSGIPSVQERQTHADELASAHGWQALRLPAGDFNLMAYLPKVNADETLLTLYLEGDGFAWVSRSQPSSDPTPRDPLALRLALAQASGNAVYLARPCQYINAANEGCNPRYWTEARFAAEVIDATNIAIDTLKQHYNTSELVLVGYSGGGAIAALVAARRTDVVRLVTVAGNLDHRAWTAHHRVAPLRASLNPADVAASLVDLPQTHYVGGLDRVIPLELAQRWPVGFRGANNKNLRLLDSADHSCCWVPLPTSLY
ncbi:alpha/beta hydrolase family protein [Nitrincola sp.]|uniref:alpha/beta hydrolase family protein n=1 Tax=Nitrincola sp. TaxID=1926584 RepID=UPI003A8FD125